MEKILHTVIFVSHCLWMDEMEIGLLEQHFITFLDKICMDLIVIVSYLSVIKTNLTASYNYKIQHLCVYQNVTSSYLES